MASLDMYNSEQKGHHHQCIPMSPRISFSNDFVDVQQALKQQEQRGSRSDAPAVSSDFEFSVTNYSMMSADELFFKGKLLSFKDNFNNNNQMQQHRATTTLKEELLINDDECDGFSLKPPKGSSTRWKGLLGLRKTHIGSKKLQKSEASSEGRSALVNEEPPINITSSQELMNEGGSSCRDLEIGI